MGSRSTSPSSPAPCAPARCCCRASPGWSTARPIPRRARSTPYTTFCATLRTITASRSVPAYSPSLPGACFASSCGRGAANRASRLVRYRLRLQTDGRVALCVVGRRLCGPRLQVALVPLPGLIRVRLRPGDGGRRLRVTTCLKRTGQRLEAGIGGGFMVVHESSELRDGAVVEGGSGKGMVDLRDGGVVLSDLADSVLHPAGGDKALRFGETHLSELRVEPRTSPRVEGDGQLRPLDAELDRVKRVARQTVSRRGRGRQATEQHRNGKGPGG